MRTSPKFPSSPIILLLAQTMLVGGCATCDMPRIDPSGERLFVSQSGQTAPLGVPVGSQPVVSAPDACAPAGATAVPVAAAGPTAAIGGPITVDQKRPRYELIVWPGKTIAPVGSEVVLLAGIRDQENYLRKNEPLEWILTPESAGYFVNLKDTSCWDYLALDFTHPRKVNSHYALGSTTRLGETLTRGTPTPTDDVKVLEGQAWISVTSPTEGVSRVAVYSSKIKEWDSHRKTAIIHWIDAEYGFPAPKVAPAGTRQLLTTTVQRHSDLVPCTGWSVRYRVTSGPSAGFSPNGAVEIEVPVNEAGQATVELFQPTPTAGVNAIGIEVFRPPMNGAEKLRIGGGTTTVEWTAPKMSVQKSGPAQAGLNDDLRYRLVVTNPGPLTPSNVTLMDEIPVGCDLVSADPPAQRAGNEVTWQVGPVAPNQTLTFDIILRPKRPGTFTSCARVAADGGVVAQSCISTEVAAPAITVQVSGPTAAQVGQTVHYEIAITNRGRATASGLLIKNRFDDGFVHSEAKSPIERDLGSLAPGQTQTVGVDFTVIKPGLLRQQVEVTGPGGIYASQETTLSATEAAAVPPPASPGTVPGTLPPADGRPDLPGGLSPPRRDPPGSPPGSTTRPPVSVAMSLPASAVVGQPVDIVVQVRNTGTEPVVGSRLTLYLNKGLDPKESTEGLRYTADPNEWYWDLLKLEPNGSSEFRLRCECIDSGSALPVVAAVRLASGGIIESPKTITIRPAAGGGTGTVPPPTSPTEIPAATETPTLKVTASELDDPIAVGKETTYEILVENAGRTAARDVAVTVSLPRTLQPVDLGTSPENQISGQFIVFVPIPTIDPGTTKGFRVRARATGAGQAIVGVTVKADGLGIPVTANEETQILEAR